MYLLAHMSSNLINVAFKDTSLTLHLTDVDKGDLLRGYVDLQMVVILAFKALAC